MTAPPSPHPLDFDWRYDQRTTDLLVQMLRGAGPVIALGTPSVARRLESEMVSVTLVDRQPQQGVSNHIVRPVEGFETPTGFRTAIIDPPWYPRQLRQWSIVGGRAVGAGGTVLVSVWPEDTRPLGGVELAHVLDELSAWADIERNVATLGYAEPDFETAARARGEDPRLSQSPLVGELVRLQVRRSPPSGTRAQLEEQWLRFTLDDYQLALRIDSPTGRAGVNVVDAADGWMWPFVSARAPSRRQIGLWSSAGEVAAVGTPHALADALRDAIGSPDGAAFEATLASAAPELLTWRIPRPPYRRSIEWMHQQ